jgi:hypothetical protein
MSGSHADDALSRDEESKEEDNTLHCLLDSHRAVVDASLTRNKRRILFLLTSWHGCCRGSQGLVGLTGCFRFTPSRVLYCFHVIIAPYLFSLLCITPVLS